MSALSLSDLEFPPSRQPTIPFSEALRQRGFGWRSAEQGDVDFMRRLYETLRADEMALIAWPENTRASFLDSQFVLQHRHFTTHFEHAEFLVLEHAGTSIGRLYLLRAPPRWLIVDIGLLPTWQNHGLGGALIQQLQQEARNARAQGLSLHVRLDNPRAHALYLRLGFQNEGVDGMHLLMHWDVPAAT
ncbi:GNAT family N-acetyltransferase [Dyella dinghuensis]|uniref:GNAT family N-acetyltransferase n=1 Tax=Dyella dinghuensis TaxID=1920169 RepID=A0A432LS58_9GAMM|nr:GNAT family N-acetyltransferase [Dyella dinghuensis]RUL63396.1 GNAT family N-acetyltransferase [Dyella dinghuensis]